VEGAEADQVRAVLAQLDAAAADQSSEIDLAFEPVDLLVGDARHREASTKNLVKTFGKIFRLLDPIRKYTKCFYTVNGDRRTRK
jgi:hypothetical protein